MTFAKKTWKNRLAQFPLRRQLVKLNESVDSNNHPVYTMDVVRAEGTVTEEGDAFSAANMNNLETRIANEFTSLNSSLSTKELTFEQLSTPRVEDWNQYEGSSITVSGNTVVISLRCKALINLEPTQTTLLKTPSGYAPRELISGVFLVNTASSDYYDYRVLCAQVGVNRNINLIHGGLSVGDRITGCICFQI